ncbi:MAG: hypothetical protein AAFQ07_15690, partial [Chloroflexota bacterium]
ASLVCDGDGDLDVPFGETYSVVEPDVDGWNATAGTGTGFAGISGFDADALPDDLVYDVADDRFCESNPDATFPFNLEKFCEHTVTNTVDAQCVPETYLNFEQGTQLNGNPVAGSRSFPDRALVLEDLNADTGNFVSLGYNLDAQGAPELLGGTITLRWADNNVILPQPGLNNDFIVWETTFNDSNRAWEAYKEQALIEVSADGVTWYEVGTARQDMGFDLPAELAYAQYVRVTDTTQNLNDRSFDGFDLDAVLGYGCGDIPVGTVTVVKDGVEGSDDSFNFSIGDVNFTLTDGQSQVFEVAIGDYTVSEAPDGAYELVDITIEGDNGNSSEDGTTASLTVDSGENIIVTFTNELVCTLADIDPEGDLVSTQIRYDAVNDVWYAEVTNSSTICDYRVGMASYEKNGNGGLGQQVLFDSDPEFPADYDPFPQSPNEPLFDGDEG